VSDHLFVGIKTESRNSKHDGETKYDCEKYECYYNASEDHNHSRYDIDYSIYTATHTFRSTDQ
jgi:hypothetical protein